MKLVLTCEHGGNSIPDAYQYLFLKQEVLETHKGYDIGALSIFKNLKVLANYSNFSTTSRLVIELNRSLHHRQLFSEFTKSLSPLEKAKIIENYYLIYRYEVEATINNFILNQESVIHLSIHTFTPILNNVERHCDIGLLFDSRNQHEKQFAIQLKTKIKAIDPKLIVRFNYPYLGKVDGFTTYLRKQFSKNYTGIEIEVNQKFYTNNISNNSINYIIKQALYQVMTHKKNRYKL